VPALLLLPPHAIANAARKMQPQKKLRWIRVMGSSE